MSQVTVTDVKDVKTMEKVEINEWIASHERCLTRHMGGRYTSIMQDDLKTLREELKRREKLDKDMYTNQDLGDWLK